MGGLNLTRRSFLKVAGTAAAVAGMASTVGGAGDPKTHKSYTDEGMAPLPDKVVTAGCPWCRNRMQHEGSGIRWKDCQYLCQLLMTLEQAAGSVQRDGKHRVAL